MISASHNPPEDNGIKGFNGLGEKLAQDEEEAIERSAREHHETPKFHGDGD